MDKNQGTMKKGAFNSIWAHSEKARENALQHIRDGSMTEVREMLPGDCLRVWYMKDGKTASHLYKKGELDNRSLGQSWIPDDLEGTSS